MSQGVDTRLCLPKTAWPPTWLFLSSCLTSEAMLFLKEELVHLTPCKNQILIRKWKKGTIILSELGIGVFVETNDIEDRLVDEYISLVKLTQVDTKDKEVKLELGNFVKELNW